MQRISTCLASRLLRYSLHQRRFRAPVSRSCSPDRRARGLYGQARHQHDSSPEVTWMVGDFTVVYSIQFDCTPTQLEPACHLPLPHRSPLGSYGSQQFEPGEYWPANFLCSRHGLACVRSPEDIRSDLETRLPGAPVPPMWRIACICAHKDCGREHTFYAARMPNWQELARRIVKLSPRIPCGDHNIEWRIDLLRGSTYAHD